MAYQWDSFREPRTPEGDRESERERQRLHQLQMTSPSIRRQREHDHGSLYHSITLGNRAMHLLREGLTGSKGLSKAFNLDMLSNCKIVGDAIQNQMKVYLQPLDLLYLCKSEQIHRCLQLGLHVYLSLSLHACPQLDHHTDMPRMQQRSMKPEI